jgi:peptidoglycan hydrolase FlgJ
MRHAELSTAPLAPAASTAPTRPTPALGGGAGFGRAFADVQGEVADFIKNGGGFEVHRLTPAAQALRAQTQGAAAGSAGSAGAGPAPNQQAFLDAIAPWAREAASKLGVAPELVSAHAALESGWGQRPLKNADGSNSHNVFGMKAGALWNGAVAENTTTEYVQGAAVKASARFRAYPDQASAFRDYAQMLLDNPRFRGALGAGSDARAFAEGLARGGYATDPNYAAKLQSLAARLSGVSG